MMKTLRSFTLFLLFVTLFAGFAVAQKTTSKRPVPRPTPTSKTSKIPPLDVRAERVKVSNQLYNLKAFVERLGPVAQNIEALDNDARTKKIKKESIDQNEAAKQKVVTAIRGLREGLVSLETDFRTKPDLKQYLPSIQGISDLAGQSLDSAIAGKFVASVSPLRSVQQKLNDTLALIPNVEL
jgi:hypothetical protein